MDEDEEASTRCFYCDEPIELTENGWEMIVCGYYPIPEHCMVRYAELVSSSHGDIFYALDNAGHDPLINH